MRRLPILLAIVLTVAASARTSDAASGARVVGDPVAAASSASSAPSTSEAARPEAHAPPDTVTYQTWFGDGTRVVFAHDVHADELELACSECHHAENCQSCHLERPVTALVTTAPVALHGACFRCHEQGASLEECGICHEPLPEGAAADPALREGVRAAARFDAQALDSLAREHAGGALEIVGEALPFERETPLPPEEQIFLVSREKGVSLVQFSHHAHAEQYGLLCAECHHMQRCGHCHGEVASGIPVVSLEAALMDNCIACHQDRQVSTTCETCHHDPHDM
jgi:hypothetical protein